MLYSEFLFLDLLFIEDVGVKSSSFPVFAELVGVLAGNL